MAKEVGLPQGGLLTMPSQHREQLCLECRPWLSAIQVCDEGVLGIVEHDGCTESISEVLGESRFSDAYRTFDGNVAEVQYRAVYQPWFELDRMLSCQPFDHPTD